MQENNIYEIGFHVIPTLSEEALSKEWSEIKSFIESAGAKIHSEGFPKPQELAYEMAKEEKGAYRKFNDTYFGWVKFTVEADKINDIKAGFEARPNILRSITVKTVEDNTLYGDMEKKDEKKASESKPESAEVPAESSESSAS